MQFYAAEFIYLFLPLVLVAYHALESTGRRDAALSLLLVASLLFYAWWKPQYLLLILASIGVNFALGLAIALAAGSHERRRARRLLVIGITGNLACLGYFKYSYFLLDSVGRIGLPAIDPGEIVLPLAISFFSFQQIAYLVDVYRGAGGESSVRNYALYVSFFPQLIAGPIVRYHEIAPALLGGQRECGRLRGIALGALVFSIGLVKKVVIADGMAQYANPLFDAAASGTDPTLLAAWGGALAYTFQIYYDFSGYTDMAIGIAWMFGVRLPVNFASPYKAQNIIEFWRRWHMTLSRFLRDYLYIPLGGNRLGRSRQYTNILLTMTIGGLWHGAGWSFVFWGALHGSYLVVNHCWRSLLDTFGYRCRGSPIYRGGSWLLTFVAVVVAWVFFRAQDFATAQAVLHGMAGLNGVVIREPYLPLADQLPGLGDFLLRLGITVGALPDFWGLPQVASLIAAAALALGCPNSQEVGSRFARLLAQGGARLEGGLAAFPALAGGLASGLLVAALLLFGLLANYWHASGPVGAPDFIYYQF